MYRLPKKVKAYFSLWGEVQGSRLIISGSDLQIEAYGFEYPAWAVEGLGSGIAAHVDSRGTLWVTHTQLLQPPAGVCCIKTLINGN